MRKQAAGSGLPALSVSVTVTPGDGPAGQRIVDHARGIDGHVLVHDRLSARQVEIGDFAKRRSAGPPEDDPVSGIRRNGDGVGPVVIRDGAADHGTAGVQDVDDIARARRLFALVEDAIAIAVLEHSADDGCQRGIDRERHHGIDHARR